MGRAVLIADDHPLFRDALKQALTKAQVSGDICEAATLGEAQQMLSKKDISLLLLDLHMDDSNGFSGLIAIRQEYPAMPVVVVSGSEDPGVIRRAICFGAAGFIPKSSSLGTITDALVAVTEGDIWAPPGVDLSPQGENEQETKASRLADLTPAQLRVLVYVVRGLLNKQIAHEMNISEATVKAHLTAIFRKLDVISRTQAVLVARELDVESANIS
jgi:DNA-binding NarL/FixJ family response regulator